MERRQFFYLAGLGSTTILAGNLLTGCSKDDESPDTGNPSGSKKVTIDLASPDYAGLAAVGGSAIKDNILIIHTGESSFTALSKICTHEGCTVGFNGTEVVCPCHGSRFSTVGAVINGPASSPLKKYATEVTGSMLTITV